MKNMIKKNEQWKKSNEMSKRMYIIILFLFCCNKIIYFTFILFIQ